MRKSILGLSAIALVAFSAPAFAQEEADDGLGLTVTGGATVVSDYRFRGISQSSEDFAVQGSVTVSHESGLYAGFWGSSISFAQGTEIDAIVGFTHEIVPGLTGDLGVTAYLYPNKVQGISANEIYEPYVSLSGAVGPASVKVGFAWAPKQEAYNDGVKNNENTYLWGDVGVQVPNTPIKLTGHLGWTSNHFNRTFLVDDSGDSRADLIDYSIGASVAYKALTFGVSWVGTDLPSRFDDGAGVRVRESLGADSAVVFSLGASF